MQGPSGVENISTAGVRVDALVFSYAKEGGVYAFQIKLSDMGSSKKGVALMMGSEPDFPSEQENYSVPVTVKSVNSYGLESIIPPDIVINVSELEAKISAKVNYQEPSKLVSVNVSNSTSFLTALNNSEAVNFGGVVLVPYSENVSSVIDAVAIASDNMVTYELPTGLLQVHSLSRVPITLIPGNVSSEFALADLTLPTILGNRTIGDVTIPSRKVPVDSIEGDVLNATVTLNIVFGELDSVNAVVSLE
jgi:hypothetical protein